MSTTGRDSDTTIEENEKVRSSEQNYWQKHIIFYKGYIFYQYKNDQACVITMIHWKDN